MTSEQVETNVGTGLKCRTLGSLALTLAKLLQSGRALSDFVRLWHINAELVRQKLDDVWRQQYHLRLPAHAQQFFTIRFTPAAKRSYTNTSTVGQFLFRHCFHIAFAIE